jgi:hypothetical protein
MRPEMNREKRPKNLTLVKIKIESLSPGLIVHRFSAKVITLLMCK